jgi:hypothetical protein
MCRRVRNCCLAPVILLAIAMSLAAEDGATLRGSVPAGAASEIRLDGRLDESAWAAAEVAELIQQAPIPGGKTPYLTRVRVLIRGNALYFGFECADPSPSRIAIHTMERDGEMAGDDTVAVVLDTYGDRRTGYLFEINAAGARSDGLVAGLDRPDRDWDGIWDARTARTASGWTAEIVIPSRTLSFTEGLDHWGLNFERSIARDRTVLRWSSPTLDSFLYDLSRAGRLYGIDGLEQGLGIEVSPYIAGRVRDIFREEGRLWNGAGGVDATYRITPQLAAVFTANTDFAETEVDSRQLNVTRFPLFFPERRAFFLEGSNQYQFGLGLGDNFIPFFSRRIGLFQGEQIPIDAGVKLNGRVGRWNIGFLDVQTRETRLRSGNVPIPGTNLLAARASYDWNRNLRIGTLLTNGHPDGRSRNTLIGADVVWRTSEFLTNKNLLVGGWTAHTRGDVPEGNRNGWGFQVDYPNDRWNCGAGIGQFGDGLQPALGFLPRPGTRRIDANCEFNPRPSKDGPFAWVRQTFMEHRYFRVVNSRGQLESQRFWWAPINTLLESGDRFEFNWLMWYEFLPAPFEIAPGVVLPAAGYRFDRFRAEFQTSRHRLWQAGNTTWFGTFYNGRLLQQENYLRFAAPTGRWQVGLSTEQNFGRLAQGTFVQRLFQVNVSYAFNPNLVWTSFLQYDTESQNVGNNMRLRWTVKPGNDVFLVWNRSWQRLLFTPGDLSLVPDSELLAVKLRWTFRR